MTGLTMVRYREALARGCVAVAACAACGRQQTIPADTCFACGSGQLTVRDHSGAGRVFSWVVTHYAFADELATETPYVVVLVSLDGGGRVYGRLAAADKQQSRVQAESAVELDQRATRELGYPVYQLVAAALR